MKTTVPPSASSHLCRSGWAYVASLVLCTLAFLSPSVAQAAGAVDTTFNPFIFGGPRNKQILVTPKGSLIYNSNQGGYDFDFNRLTNAGHAPFVGPDNFQPILVQPDGKILARYYGVFGTSGINRLTADGAPELDFPGAAEGSGHPDVVPICGVYLADGRSVISNGYRLLWLNPDGSVGLTFDVNAIYASHDGGIITSMALQPDGKIVIATEGKVQFAGDKSYLIVRINADGTRDGSFGTDGDVRANNSVHDMICQPDGRILIAGQFTHIAPYIPRRGLARLESTGAVDATFNPGIGGIDTILYGGETKERNLPQYFDSARAKIDFKGHAVSDTYHPDPYVLRMALQTDGKIIAFGEFVSVDFNGRKNMARFHPDGGLDHSFVANVDHAAGADYYEGYEQYRCVWNPYGWSQFEHLKSWDDGPYWKWFDAGLAIQENGQVLVGGEIKGINSSNVTVLARLNNDPASSTIEVSGLGSTVRWKRSGAGPELMGARLEASSDNGATWSVLGHATRIGTTSDWELTGLNLTRGLLRARGLTHRGGLTEHQATFEAAEPPTVGTPTATNLTTSSARLGGTVVTENKAAITERGVVYLTVLGPDDLDPVIGGQNVQKVVASGPAGTGAFSVDVSGLSHPFQYSYKAYATNSVGTSYSPVATFTTLDDARPTLINPTVTNPLPTTVQLGATVSDPGTAPITERGVVYALTSVNPDPKPLGNSVTKVIYTGTENPFKVPVSVGGGGSYSFRAYAINGVGQGLSPVGTFTTPTTTPTVTALAATGINSNGATLNGTVNANGSPTTWVRFRIWRVSDNWEYGEDATPAQVAGSSTTAVSGIFSAAPHTAYRYRLEADFNGGWSTVVSTERTFTTPNTVPVATAGTGSALEDSGSGVQVRASDADRDELTYTVVTPPAHGTLVSQDSPPGYYWDAHTWAYTPAANYHGSDSFTYRVSDGFGGVSNTATVNITVLPENDPPTIGAIANPAAINEDAGQQTVNLTGIGSGAPNETQTLTVTATSSNPALIPNPTVTYTSASSLGSLKYTPVANANGTAVITVTVQDSGGSEASNSFLVTVNAVNDAPSFTLPAGGTPGVTWTPRQSNRQWISIASSADGTKLGAVVSSGQIYTSTDSGVTWTARENSRLWQCIASSADGTKLAAVQFNGYIFTSADSGVTWTARGDYRQWVSIASSADGTKLAAVATGGSQIYTSTDSGVTWTARESPRAWACIASSADGTKLAAGEKGGQIYISTNSGGTWTARASNRDWDSIASSSDGTKLAAVVYPGQIYTSTDSGVTWTARESSRSWTSIASSSDGTKLAAAEFSGQIYTSTDSGVTWTARESSRSWQSIASSADGTKLAAVVSSGQIYTSVAPYGISAASGAGAVTVAALATSISSGPANESAQTVSFNLSNDNNALFTTQPAIASNGTLTFTPNPSATGTAAVTATAQDNGGTANGGVDTSGVQTITITVTASAPTVTSPTVTNLTGTGATLGGNVTGTGGSAITERGVVYSLTSANPNPTIGGAGVTKVIASGTTGVFTVNTPTLSANSSYSFRAYAINAIGTAYIATVGTFSTDGTAPDTTILSGPPAATSATSATITFSGTDNVAVTSFEGSLDGAAYETVVSPVSFSSLPQAAHTFNVRAKDAAGNVDPTPASVTWTVDTKAPTFALPGPLTAEATGPGGATVAYTASASDSGSGVAVASFTPASGSTFALGTRQVNASATDNAGNTATGSFTVTVRDTTPPLVTLNGAATMTIEMGSAFIDPGATAADAVAGAPTVSVGGSVNTALLGVYTLTYSATDAAGNTGSATRTVTVRDSTRPETTITSGPSGTVNSASAIFAFSADEPATFTYSLNGGATTTAAGPATFAGLGEGMHTFSVFATDTAGNADLTPATRTWTVDATPPTLTLPAPIIAEATSGSGAVVIYTASASDAGGLASSSFTPASGSTFPLGTTTVQASASDNAGNTATGSFTVTVRDTTAPVVTGPANSTVHATSPSGAYVTFTPTATDAVGVTSLTASPASGSFIPNGTTTVTVTAKDAAGNTGTGQFRVTVTPLTAEEQWRYENFGTAENSGPSAPNGDWDGDGVSNLLELAFGTSPTSTVAGVSSLAFSGSFAAGGALESRGQPIVAQEPTPTGVDFRALYVRRKNAATVGLTYTVEFCATLGGAWQARTVTPTVLADDGDYELVSVPYPFFVGGKKARFFHVKVSIAP